MVNTPIRNGAPGNIVPNLSSTNVHNPISSNRVANSQSVQSVNQPNDKWNSNNNIHAMSNGKPIMRPAGHRIIGTGTGVLNGREHYQSGHLGPPIRKPVPQQISVDTSVNVPQSSPIQQTASKNIYSEGGGYYRPKPPHSPQQGQSVYPTLNTGNLYGNKGSNIPSYGNIPYNIGYGSNPVYDGQYYVYEENDNNVPNHQADYSYDYGVDPGISMLYHLCLECSVLISHFDITLYSYIIIKLFYN